MSRRSFERLVAAVAAALATGLCAASTVFVAGPVYGPVRDELHWSSASLLAAGTLSLVVTAAAFPACCALACAFSIRAVATAGSLAAGLLLLLVLPVLNHLWQLFFAAAALGAVRPLVVAAAWTELRRFAGTRWALPAVAGAIVVALVVVTPWLADLVYRESWREAVAASGGAMLLIATPLTYVLLPGRAAAVTEP